MCVCAPQVLTVMNVTIEYASCRSCGEFAETPLEKSPLRLLTRELERALVRRACVRGPTEPAAEIRARRVRETIVQQVPARENPVDDVQAGRGSVAHRQRHGPVQLNHGRRRRAQ